MPRLLPRDPWLRFAVLFGALAVASELVYYGLALESPLFRTYLEAVARISAWILGWLGDDVHVQGVTVTSPLFAVEIGRGCDAYRMAALLTSAIVAFPAPVAAKAWGIALGLLWINLLNFTRIVGLFYVGGYWRPHFQTAHEVYFPVLLIALTAGAWLLWVRRASRIGDAAPASA